MGEASIDRDLVETQVETSNMTPDLSVYDEYRVSGSDVDVMEDSQ